MQKEENLYHLEQIDEATWKLFQVSSSGKHTKARLLKSK